LISTGAAVSVSATVGLASGALVASVGLEVVGAVVGAVVGVVGAAVPQALTSTATTKKAVMRVLFEKG